MNFLKENDSIRYSEEISGYFGSNVIMTSPGKVHEQMVKMIKFKDLVLSSLMACFTAVVFAGCDGTSAGVLQDAAAVQLETSFISMLDGLLRTLIYNAMDIPGTLY
jgi:hypothetical protein